MGKVSAMNLNQLARHCYKQAVTIGWWEEHRDFGTIIALIHSEASEAYEEYRNHKPLGTVYTVNGKPEGIPAEMADIIIRVLDFCGRNAIDIQQIVEDKLEYNKTRGHRHGGKRT
jgi:NTP pyrophosphatase (non-canonical NTP hydrolase)